MKKYHKIQTLYERDGRGKIVTQNLTRPIYGTIKDWAVTEKVNGTNIRIGFTMPYGGCPAVKWELAGRTDTDTPDIPDKLVRHVTGLAVNISPVVRDIMDGHGLERYTLYGEGYGAGIHKGGRYRDDNGFILFDVAVHDLQMGQLYLSDDVVTKTAKELDIPRVPLLNSGETMTIEEIVELVRYGYASDVAEKFDENFLAEGIVARPVEPLYDNRKERVMFKLKSSDFD